MRAAARCISLATAGAVLWPCWAQAHVVGAATRAGDLTSVLATGIPMLLAAALYLTGSLRVYGMRLRTRETSWRALSFSAGLIVLAAALLSPLDTWAATRFSAHMTQHELLMLVAAPLLVLGRPLPLFLWAFSPPARVAIGRFLQKGSIHSFWTVLHSAGCAWILHALALWVWHVPRFFNAAVENQLLHDLQHISFLATALLFWSALFQARRATEKGAGIVYLFTTTLHTGILGALITLASQPWYASSLEDQQLGGLIMWIPGSIVYVGAALVLFARWISGTPEVTSARS